MLLAHRTHMVSVVEDEVLFFLKRGLRVLGGACGESREGFVETVVTFSVLHLQSAIQILIYSVS